MPKTPRQAADVRRGSTSGTRMRGTWRALVPCLLVGAVALSACASQGSSKQKARGDLVIANAVNVDSLDPAANVANQTIWIDEVMYQRLFKTDVSGTKIISDLASKYAISEDRLTYTIELKDSRFSHGPSVKASDVVFSLNRAIKYPDGWGFLMKPVKSITAPDQQTVQITLSQPHTPLLAALAMYAFSILPEQRLKEQGATEFFKKPESSGPFHLTKWVPGSGLTLSKNKYWNGEQPNINEIHYKIIPDGNTRMLQLQSKQVDIVENPPSSTYKTLEKSPELRLDLFPSSRIDFVTLNNTKGPFRDKNVRLAVDQAIDRSAINKVAWAGKGAPASSILPYKMLYWNDQLPVRVRNIDDAKTLLAQSGYPNGFKTTLAIVSGDKIAASTAVVIKSNLEDLGIDVTIDAADKSTTYSRIADGNFAMGLQYYTNDIIDPDEVATDMDPTTFIYAFDSHWSNPDAHEWIETARSTRDADTRKALYFKLQKAVYDESPVIPLVYAPFAYGSGKWVEGFNVSSLGDYSDSLLKLRVNRP